MWYGDLPFERRISFLKTVGYNYVELSLDYPFPESLDANELRDILESFEMGIAFHAPLDVFIAQPRDEIFRASMKVVEKCVDFVSNFETIYYNFHLTYFCPTREFEKVKEKILENGRKACEFIVEKAENFGFEACLEFDRNFDERVLVEGLKICLDIGHFALANRKDFANELKNFVGRFGDRILVAHVHDCDVERKVDHITLGNGKLDLKGILDTIRAEFFTLETFWRDSERGELRDIDIIYDYETLRRLLERGE